MELVPCPITGDRDFTPWLEAPDRFNLTGHGWSIVRSDSSNLLMLNPRPDEAGIPEHYPSRSYDPFIHQGNHRSARDRAYLIMSSLLLGRKAAQVMKGLHKPSATVRLLEAGCSTGRLLMHLHRHYGIPVQNLYGIEPDPHASGAAKASGLERIYGTGLDETDFGCRFDRIVFWHVLEHIHRIGSVLDAARTLLEPDGMLIIALPNIDSFDAGRYRSNWIALDAPRHLYHFTPETLGILLEKHGFSVLDVKPYLPDALYNVWYSERLARAISGRRFGVGAVAKAAAMGVCSIVKGLDPMNSSGFVCRAVRSGA